MKNDRVKMNERDEPMKNDRQIFSIILMIGIASSQIGVNVCQIGTAVSQIGVAESQIGVKSASL